MVRLMASSVRLYVEHPLSGGQTVPVEGGQAHYLFGVMRLGAGAEVQLFNGQDGEWTAVVEEAGRKRGRLQCRELAAPQGAPPDLWLLFAPVKKDRTDFIVEKAVELGVARICPVVTEFTQAKSVRVDRMRAQVVEAAEQCGATWVPEVADPLTLDALITGWDVGRMILFCDEVAAGTGLEPGLEQFRPDGDAAPGPWAVLIGPEGGFSPRERDWLDRRLEGTTLRVALGPRILRADTAAVAALTLWQATLGDWR